MKKIFLPIFVLISSISFAQAPCVPGTLTTSGNSYILPDAITNFKEACVNEYYEQIVYMKVPKDTSLGIVSATIDSFVISKNVTGMPVGLTVEGVPGILPASPSDPKTNFERMKIKGDSLACLKISGIIATSNVPGNYNLIIPIRAYMKIGGFVPLDSAINLSTYSINVKPTGTCFPASISNLDKYSFDLIGNSPNPFTSNTTISFQANNTTNYDLKIMNAMGAVVYAEKVKSQSGMNYVNINGSQFSAGMYMIVLSDDKNRLTQKMLVK
jgi:hypothetical protein